MLIGVPREIKNHEYRVGLTPASVAELVHRGHQVLVETTAGNGIGAADEDYVTAGASIAKAAADVFAASELIVKVKEPQPNECRHLRKDQMLFTYLHLAADPEQARLLLASEATAIAYETVRDVHGGLPLLAPMSEVAGRLSIQAGAHCLERAQGGAGILLGGVTGVAPAKVLIVGAGVVGENAAQMACGLGADVTLVDRSLSRLRELSARYGNHVHCLFATGDALERLALEADLVIGAVLVPGAATPKLLSRTTVARMKTGAVLVDVAIDQGGCFETSRATTHDEPTFVVDGVVHYCVTNMPGAAPRTSTFALNNAILPYVLALADHGVEWAMRADAGFAEGLNVRCGRITCAPVADALGYELHAAGGTRAA